jgi:hypothetical protein
VFVVCVIDCALFPPVSGMSRLRIGRMPAVPITDVKNYLLQHTKFSNAQMEQVVDVVGSHMGDVSDVMATFLDKDEEFVNQHLKGQSVRLVSDRILLLCACCVHPMWRGDHPKRVGSLEHLINRSEPAMIQVLTGDDVETSLPLSEFTHAAHKVFQAFEKSQGQPVDVVQVLETTGLGFHQFKALTKTLVKKNLLVDIGGERLGLYTPHQRHTYRIVKDEPVVIKALAES